MNFGHKIILVMLYLVVVGGMFNVCAMQENQVLREKLKEQVKADSANPFDKKNNDKKQEIAPKPEEVALVQKADQAKPAEKKEDTGINKAASSDKAVEEKNIYLNFENTDLNNFINYIAELKQINLIPLKETDPVKVSLTIRHPLTVEGAWRVFLTVIEMAGFSIVEVGDVFKIIPAKDSPLQPLPSFINVPSDTLPDSDLTIRYVVFMENITAKSVESLLQSMLSEKGKVITHEESNGFVITDKSYNIKAAVKLLQELDASGRAETVVVMKLKNVNASDVKELLTSLTKDDAQQSPLAKLLGKTSEGSGKYFPPGTRIIAEERTNTLVLLGLAEPIKKIENFITNHVDTALKATESPLHIYELQYTDADQISSILKEVTKAPEGGPGQQASKYGAIRGGVKYFKSMNFEVDKGGNRLIISSTDKEDWELLRKTIEDLDKPQPQVAIETMFVSINAKDFKSMGGSLRNKAGKFGNLDMQSIPQTGATTFKRADDGSTPISLLGNMLNQIVGGFGSSVLTFGKKTDIWGAFEVVKQITNASVLSQPFMTIANKTEGILTFGSDKRVVQDTSDGGASGIIAVSANNTLKITPQINLDGIIRLKIDLLFEDFIGSTQSPGDKQVKTLNTAVTVADGQVLILGGLVQTKVDHDKRKTPLLADIPILGWLFKKEDKTVDETYIFIFMSPNIIKPRKLPGMGLYTKMKLHQATDQIERGIVTTKTKDPIFNWYFNADKVNYSHKVIDYANARYQPTTVDIKNDPYYRSYTERELEDKKALSTAGRQEEEAFNLVEDKVEPNKKSVEKKLLSDKKPVAVEQKLEQEKFKEAQVKSDKQTAMQNRVTKRLQEKRQELMVHDEDLEKRRLRLKEVVAQATQPAPESVQVQEQREQFKEIFSPNNSAAQEHAEVLVDTGKRNRLKEFLSKGTV